MVLGVCGFGFSGSGAVLDWLKEYPDVFVFDKMEFSFPYKPDGLEDLGNAICYHPVRYFSSDSAIRRYIQYMNRMKNTYNHLSEGRFEDLLNDYLSKIVQLQWQGATSVHYYQASSFDYLFRQQIPRSLRWHLNRWFNIVIHRRCWPEKKMYYSFLSEDLFIKYSKDFVSNFIDSLSHNTQAKIIALDQCFPANDPAMSFKFFEDPVAITVIRDPRDNYLLAKRALGYESSFIPRQRVEDFIIYYRGLMDSRNYQSNREKIIEIQFEDMVYKPERTFAQLEKIIGLPHVDVHHFHHFNPTISVNNTQLWLKYPEYNKEVTLIENELSDYLYPFNEFDLKPSFRSRTF